MTKSFTIEVDGETIQLYSYGVPMMHEDWHDAEANDLKYLYFNAEGNDYWDYDMMFVKSADFEKAQKWEEERIQY